MVTEGKIAEDFVIDLTLLFSIQEFENRMTTPRNSVSGTFPIESTRGPLAMQASQKRNLRRPSSLVGPTQSFFMRESKALGVRLSSSIPHPEDVLAYRC